MSNMAEKSNDAPCGRGAVARIERSEIRDRPINLATPLPGFAGAQPGLRAETP